MPHFWGADGKLTYRFEILSINSNRCVQHQALRASNRVEGIVFGPADPRDGRAIAKANNKFGAKLHLAGTSKNDTHQIGLAISSGHEVDQSRGAGLGLEFGFENERIGKVATAHFWRRAYGCDQPSSIFRRSEEGGKTCR